MARPKIEEVRNIEMKIRLTEKEYREVQELAEHIEIPVTTLARNFLLYAKRDAEFLKRFGILKGAKKFVEFEEKFGEFIDGLSVGAGQAQGNIKKA